MLFLWALHAGACSQMLSVDICQWTIVSIGRLTLSL
jgi:hypothetical protein